VHVLGAILNTLLTFTWRSQWRWWWWWWWWWYGLAAWIIWPTSSSSNTRATEAQRTRSATGIENPTTYRQLARYGLQAVLLFANTIVQLHSQRPSTAIDAPDIESKEVWLQPLSEWSKHADSLVTEYLLGLVEPADISAWQNTPPLTLHKSKSEV
jgi:hypothetical protein